MAFFNQSKLQAFFSPWEVNLNISHRSLPSPTIPEDDLLRLAYFQKTTFREWPIRKMTYQEWPNPWRWLTQVGQIPVYDNQELVRPGTSITEIWCHLQVNLLNLYRGFDETNSLKPSSGEEWFWLVFSRNWKEFIIWLSGDWKTLLSHFEWTKPTHKSLSRNN